MDNFALGAKRFHKHPANLQVKTRCKIFEIFTVVMSPGFSCFLESIDVKDDATAG